MWRTAVPFGPLDRYLRDNPSVWSAVNFQICAMGKAECFREGASMIAAKVSVLSMAASSKKVSALPLIIPSSSCLLGTQIGDRQSLGWWRA